MYTHTHAAACRSQDGQGYRESFGPLGNRTPPETAQQHRSARLLHQHYRITRSNTSPVFWTTFGYQTLGHLRAYGTASLKSR
jgi:hypothetical protein